MTLGVSSLKLSLLTTDKGIKLMLALESHIAFPISEFPIVEGIEKLHGSYIFSGKDLWITALQVAIRLTSPSLVILIFFSQDILHEFNIVRYLSQCL